MASILDLLNAPLSRSRNGIPAVIDQASAPPSLGRIAISGAPPGQAQAASAFIGGIPADAGGPASSPNEREAIAALARAGRDFPTMPGGVPFGITGAPSPSPASALASPLLTDQGGPSAPAKAGGVLSTMAGMPHPKFFEKGGLGSRIFNFMTEFGLQYSAGQGNPNALMFLRNRAAQKGQQAQQEREDAQRAQDRQWAIEDRDAKLNAPQFFMSGRDRVQFDPTTGQYQTAYDGPEDYQTYAQTLGLDPNDPRYSDAVRDFVLRSNGPTALGNRTALETQRQGGRQRLEASRQQNRVDLKGTPTYAATHPRMIGGPVAPAGTGPTGPTGRPLLTAKTGAVVDVRTLADAERLPPGTRFRIPTGQVRVKK